METRGSSHHWGRELRKLGHDVRLMPAALVKPNVKRGKTDAADAEAICEAVRRSTMRFVEIKPDDQQAWLAIHHAGDLVVRQRTQVVNVIRSILREFGHILPTGIDAVSNFTREHGTQEQLEMPEIADGMKWVALRPGGVLDTLLEMNAAYLKKGEQTMPADLEVPATDILTADVACC